jgi:hypothetical protein
MLRAESHVKGPPGGSTQSIRLCHSLETEALSGSLDAVIDTVK